MSCCSIAELTAGALACSDERSVSVVLNAGEDIPYLLFSKPSIIYCSPSLSIAISRRFQPLLLMFLVALDSLQLALSIDTSLEAKSNKLRNPEGPARS
ncbi:DEAD-like helicase, N-terminal domain containing protein [Dorcoceras hygrometricum]|uniref:DEAD-like helicase, N-terminal domain containing protein n=1 Tax=Dorcoceras hygrometricum TaxID=472368 RepID=A0A2Z7BBS7_9LAMI|nr:DEAD-like helicase, N-terminal domain containing protein [Dorcoceras hygrometricum]